MGSCYDSHQRVQMNSYIFLVDCNSFYCSCERVFRPDLRRRPVVVLSNNDGCIISSTKEAKELNLGMCASLFEVKEILKKNKVAVFSSNYPLYDDLSRRVMKILGEFTRQLEIYSVDEAFLEVSDIKEEELVGFAEKIQQTVLQQTGIPVGVGVARTKVLSKLANRLSKKSGGICTLINQGTIKEALQNVSVNEIWGIGRKSGNKLEALGIKTGWDFREYGNDYHIQKILTKVGRQVQDELREISCLEMDEAEELENTGTSRSFPRPLYNKKELKEAVAHFTTKATQKLRKQNSVCYGINVYASTNRFLDSYRVSSKSHVFTTGTSDVIQLIKTSQKLVDEFFEEGVGYKKAGVMLTHLVPQNQNQLDLFSSDEEKHEGLNKVMDQINKRFGEGTLKSAACGTIQNWKTIADYKSLRYTTSWKELLKV